MVDVKKHERNLEIIQTMAANGIRGEWDTVKPYVADDIVLEMPTGLPYGKSFHGWEGYMAAFPVLGAFWTDLAIGPHEYATSDDKVVIISHLKGNITKTGKSISQPYAAVWELKNEQVTKVTAFYYDTKEIADLAEE